MHKLGTYKNLMLIRTMGNNTSVLLTLCAVTVNSGQFDYFFGFCELSQIISLVIEDYFKLLWVVAKFFESLWVVVGCFGAL